MTVRPGQGASGDESWRDGVDVRGARQNNLKDVDVHVPRDALVVFTGGVGVG